MDFVIQDIGRKFLDKDGEVWELDMIDTPHQRIVFSRMSAGEAAHIVTDLEGRQDGRQFITLRLMPLNMKQNYECGNYFSDNKSQRWKCCEYNPIHDIYRMEHISGKKRCWFLPSGFPHLNDVSNGGVRLVARVTQLPENPEVGETVEVTGPTLIDITLGTIERPTFTPEEEHVLLHGDDSVAAEFPGLHSRDWNEGDYSVEHEENTTGPLVGDQALDTETGKTWMKVPETFTGCVNLYLSAHGMEQNESFLWKDFCNWMADMWPDKFSKWRNNHQDGGMCHPERLDKMYAHTIDPNPLDFDDEAIEMLPDRRATGGPKYDADKSMVQLLPPQAVLAVGNVLRFGAQKYAPNSWHLVEEARTRYIGAGLRHIMAHIDGEIFDSESGLPHLAHGICSLMFVLELLIREQTGRNDDGSRNDGS